MSQPIETDQELSLIDHLLELRNRLIRSVVVIAVAMLAMAPFARKLYTILPHGTHMCWMCVAPCDRDGLTIMYDNIETAGFFESSSNPTR